MSLLNNTKNQLIKSLGGATHEMVTEAIEQAGGRYLIFLEQQFSFYDAQLQGLKLALQQWEDLGSVDGNKQRNLEDVARDAQLLFDYAPEAGNAVKFYTAMAVGTSLSIKIRPKSGNRTIKEADQANSMQAAFDMVFEADENEAVFSIEARQKLSNDLLVNSRVVYLFFVGPDKSIKARTLDNPFEITKLITNPEDKTEIWFYKRTWTPEGSASPRTLYYRFWRLKDKLVRVENERGEIEFYKNQEDYLRQKIDSQAKIARAGYGPDALPVFATMLEFGPIFKPAIDWVKQQARFMENRATVVRNRATYLDEYTVDGGSRAVDAIRTKLNSTLSSTGDNLERNPAPAAGSSLIHNKAIDSKQRSLATGADDAEKDGRMFRTMPAAAFGIPAALLYMDAEASGNLNAIIELMKRAQGLWESYRSVWHGFYKRMAKFVLGVNGYTTPVVIDIDAPPMVDTDLAEFAKAVIDGEAAGLVPTPEASRLYLLRLGSNNIDELVAQVNKETSPPPQAKSGQNPPQPDQSRQEISAEGYAEIISQVLKDLQE